MSYRYHLFCMAYNFKKCCNKEIVYHVQMQGLARCSDHQPISFLCVSHTCSYHSPARIPAFGLSLGAVE